MRYHLIMGNQAYSSWSLRGWLLLEPFDLDFSHEVVPLYVPGYADFENANYPANTVPTLQVFDGADKMLIWDSLAIAEFLHEQHPQAGIWPAATQARAAARSLCAEMHSSYDALRSTMPMNVRREYQTFTPDADAQADIARIEALWAWAASKWGGAGPYLFGEHFSAADAFYAPVASRFQTYGVALQPESQRYADALLNHPATLEFYTAGQRESWVMDFIEFDMD
ncbi:MAG: glutathione S-transferase [Gammaproteobacteria bacterium]